jgi:hypothetical protein
MNAPSPSGGRPPAAHREGAHHGGAGDSRDLWPREFGRDGVSGLVTLDRAMRARDVSRPGPEDERMAAKVLDSLLARVDGRRSSLPPRPNSG